MKKTIRLSAKIASTCQRMVVAKGDPFGREWKKGAEVTGADLPVS